jgi:hypothetical protein
MSNRRKQRAHKGGGRGSRSGAVNSSAIGSLTSGLGRGDDEGDLVLLTTSSSLLEKVGLGAAPTDLGPCPICWSMG